MDFVDPREAPGVGTPVRGGVTYREAHLAMEMIVRLRQACVAMEVVEVNPVIDEANRTAILGVELIMSGTGKKDSLKTRVAVIYGGRSGEHEVSLRSAESIMEALDPERYEMTAILHLQGRQVEPAADPAGARTATRRSTWSSRCCTAPSARTARCRVCSNWPICRTSGPGVMASAVSMDKEVMKRVCVRPVAGRRLLPSSATARTMRRPREAGSAIPMFVKPANLGSSVGISKAQDRGTSWKPRSTDARAVRPQDHRGARHRRAGAWSARCWATRSRRRPCPAKFCRSREFYDYEDKYLLDKTEFRMPADLPADADRRIAAPRGRVLTSGGVRGHGARRFPAGNAQPASSTSTRSTRSRALRPSACIPKMWEH